MRGHAPLPAPVPPGDLRGVAAVPRRPLDVQRIDIFVPGLARIEPVPKVRSGCKLSLKRGSILGALTKLKRIQRESYGHVVCLTRHQQFLQESSDCGFRLEEYGELHIKNNTHAEGVRATRPDSVDDGVK
jgi:hypothetical protein